MAFLPCHKLSHRSPSWRMESWDGDLMAAESLLELAGPACRMRWATKQRRSKMMMMMSRGDSNYEEKQGKVRSPTSPLSWASDSTSHLPFPPRDRPLGPCPDSKVGRGNKVHKPPSRRGPRKKSHAELKDLENGLLLEREELEKEMQQVLTTYQELRDMNEHLNVQVSLRLDRTEEGKLPCTSSAISSRLAQEIEAPGMLNFPLGFVKCEFTENLAATLPFGLLSDETLSVGRSLPVRQLKSLDKSEMGGSSMHTDAFSSGFRLPDLNIPVEDLSDNCEDVFDDQVFLMHKKAAVAAEGGKHRNELIRVEYFESCNA